MPAIKVVFDIDTDTKENNKNPKKVIEIKRLTKTVIFLDNNDYKSISIF